MATYTLDGTRFKTLEGLFDEVTRSFRIEPWGHNLDAFNDILSGGFGLPAEGFTIRWLHHALSRERLGYPETERQLRRRLERCHSENRPHVELSLAQARARSGPTVFDWVVGIVRQHENVILLLE
jgi:RNAse (barnase) inhibitor barstar